MSAPAPSNRPLLPTDHRPPVAGDLRRLDGARTRRAGRWGRLRAEPRHGRVALVLGDDEVVHTLPRPTWAAPGADDG